MANETAPAAASSQSNPPVRFTLRELFVLTGLISLAGASYSWIAIMREPAMVLFCLSVLVVIAYAAHIFLRRSLGATLFVTFLLGFFFLCLTPPFVGSPVNTRKMSCSNNLHNITLALQQYEIVNGTYPPAFIADAQGKPMHSWRVLLLPYLEQKNLYDLYHFDEPWDGPNNSKLHSIRLRNFQCPSDSGLMTDTSYVAIVGPQTIWPGTKTIRAADIIDGTSKTIILAEVANSGIHWMEPRDLDVSQMAMLINAAKGQGISSRHPGGASAAYADGSVRFLSTKTSSAELRAALTRNGKDARAP